MKVLHICLSNWFVDGVGYQENELVRQHVADGCDVLVIASTETHSEAGKLVYIEPADYIGKEGARIIRIPYRKFLPAGIMHKLRMHVGLKQHILDFMPDVILFHGTCGWELRTVARFIKNNPHVHLFVDSHEDKYNSARNFISREILHKQYYARILRSVLPTINKILCYSPESMNFVESTYKIPRQKLELFLLGGRPLSDVEYIQSRVKTRSNYNIEDTQILIVQAGKQTQRKKILESIAAISKTKNADIKFLIAGNIDDQLKDPFFSAIQSDERIHFLGWQSVESLTNLLCAADIYLQPGTQSVIMQQSLCCRCAVILDDVPSHHIYVNTNGWLIGRDGELSEILNKINSADLNRMQKESYKFATERLDYRVLAKRIFSH